MMRQGLPPRSASKSAHREAREYSADRTMDTSFSDPFSTISKSSSFQMMDITISVEVMDGLVMEVKKAKDESPIGNTPINAVISAMKNVSSSRQIATHVPSLPLSVPKASYGDKFHKIFVRWPVDFDPNGDPLSTFRFSRLMKKEWGPNDQSSNSSYCFQPEHIELAVGLMRGSEMITLGKADLVIHGNELEERVVDIPVCNEKDVVKPKKLRDPSPIRGVTIQNASNTKAKSSKALKPLSFPSDSKRKFHLVDHSMIRVQVKSVPQIGSTDEENDTFSKYPTKQTMTASTTIDSYNSFRDDSVESYSSTENRISMKRAPMRYHRDAQVDEMNHRLSQVRLTSNSRNRSSSTEWSTTFDGRKHQMVNDVRSGSSSRDGDYAFHKNHHYRDRSRGSRDKYHGYSDHTDVNHLGNGIRDRNRTSKGEPNQLESEVRRTRSKSKSLSKRDPSPMAWVYDILVGNDDEIPASPRGKSHKGTSSTSGTQQTRGQSRRTMMV